MNNQLNRNIGAAAAVVSALVHLWLWIDGVKDQGTVGALFVVNVIAGLAIAVMLVRWHHWVPLFLLAGFGVATLGCFLVAVTGSLFGISTGWSWYAWVAVVSEVVAAVCGAYGLLHEGHVARLTTGRPHRVHG
jgi:hypothetical protein